MHKIVCYGSNDCGELGLGQNVEEVRYPIHVESLDDFHIEKISCGSLHVAALTRDGKVVTWGCNDEGVLGRDTKSEGNPDENVPAYAQGLDDVVIVKVACGSNITLSLSEKGQLYATRTFRDNNGKTGFTSAINKQSMFVKYSPTSHLKIADIAVRDNHALLLMTHSDLYTFGCMDSFQLGRRILVRKPNGLMLIPEKISINRIRKIFAKGNHSFAIDDDGMIYSWGQNAEGQCGSELSNPIITPMKLEFFKNLFKVKRISAGLHHTLVLLENGNVYSFGSTRYGQLGIGASEGNRKSPVKINLDNCKYIATRDHHSMAVNNKNKVYTWGFGRTYALGNQSENNELLPFELECEEFGEITEIGGGSQYLAILSSFHN
ncbi:25165_t:CDS:2 [Gigaspora margarita]|uniref:25165_t:CDS:1 n=1 Tax=Gigaspora margarita TaxID=4874 RepID=A0ABM8VWS4_GIGMA|nr:25165_t:CDS:2 [Gigaspora margarita]